MTKVVRVNDMHDDMWDELAKAIIKQAIDDWRTLIKTEQRVLYERGLKISLMEIRRFFRSDYCQILMDDDPLIILEQLEKELERSREEVSLV
jgi:L-rhamnose mutarotase